jgi:hypothetical protein
VIVHAGATWLHGHDRLADALARSGRDAVLVEAPPRMSSLSPAAVAVDAVCALYGAGLTAFPALGRVVVQTETALDLVDAPDALHLYGAEGPPSAPADVAAGFQAAVVDVLLDRARRGAARTGVRRVTLGGGVAANSALRAAFAADPELEAYLPPRARCTDNAAMIANAGRLRLARGERHSLALGARPRWSVSEGVVC